MVHREVLSTSNLGSPAVAVTSWDDLRVLLSVYREGSFHGAGRTLRMATSTVARRISQLEASVGRILVQRTAAGTRIEADALSLVESAERLEQGLGALGRDSQSSDVSGVVRLSMSEGFVIPVTRVLAALQHANPQLRIEVVSESRLVNVSRREADIALRKVKSKEAELIEKKVGTLQFGLYASSGYIKKTGLCAPLEARDLARYRYVAYDDSGRDYPQSVWLEKHSAGATVFRSNSDLAIQAAAQEGLGICVLAVSKKYPPPALVNVPFIGTLPKTSLYLVWRKELKKVPRIRLVTEAIERALIDALGK